MSALDNILHFHRQNCCDPECYADAEALAELSALRARVAELEAAQAATLTPRKCGTCQQAAEQMREAAANLCQDLANRTDIFRGAIDTKRNREVRSEHKIYSNLVIYIRSLPLPTCCDCNPLAPSKPVDDRQVCGNCKHFERCKSLFGCSAGNTECDFSPSKFDPE